MDNLDNKKNKPKNSWWNSLSEEQKKDYLEKKELKNKDLEEKEKELTKKFDELMWNLTSLNEEELNKLFDISRKFDNFSVKNTALILFQNPEASSVAGNKAWFENWYKLKKWALWMHIFIPCRKKIFEKDILSEDVKNLDIEKIKSKYDIRFKISPNDIKLIDDTYKVVIYKDVFKLSDYKVYDISEVEERYDDNGKSLAKRLNNMTTYSNVWIEDLKSFLEKQYQITTKYEKSWIATGGFVIRWNDKEIFLNSNLDELNNIWTLIHEFSHIQMGHTKEDHEYSTNMLDPNYDIFKCLKELEAETLTYLLCKDLWIERNSAHYLKNWKDGKWIWDEKYKEIFMKVTSTYKKIKNDFIENFNNVKKGSE